MFTISRTSSALFLDFDGTLVEFADQPEAVFIPPELPDLLSQLFKKLNGAVALVSGRSIASLDSFLDLTRIPVAGGHGAEWRAQDINGAEDLYAPDFLLAVDLLTDFAQTHHLLLENKRHSAALHFRQFPEIKKTVDQFVESHIEVLQGLRVIYGNCVREIQPKGMDKGKAVARFMQLPDFAGRHPVYIGDDTTDEDAFQWVNANHGVSCKVGGGITSAQYRLESVEDVRNFLANFLMSTG
ncbi:MAG: trehalose-phosphatase [Cellvibrionaceae bacterium]|nr:trehalose-phosphatase [Cellvibrionaceae bacterium]